MADAAPDRQRTSRVQLRNGAHGYGIVTKSLHWLTVLAVLGQFVLGYTMDFDAASGRQEAQIAAESEGLEEEAEGQGEAAEESVEAENERREDAFEGGDDEVSTVFADVVTGDAFRDGLSPPELHVGLGLCVIVLAVARILWRRTTPLPPWAEHLRGGERRLEGGLEKALLTLLLVTPASGLLLVAAGEGWLPLHVAAQIALLSVVAVHVGLPGAHRRPSQPAPGTDALSRPRTQQSPGR
jgi:cytochrome b561